MKIEDDLLKDVRVLLHPIRFRIVKLLAEKPMHVKEISKALGEERRLVSYHLNIMEKYGFLKSDYEISELPKLKGKAIRKYRVTAKLEEMILSLKKI